MKKFFLDQSIGNVTAFLFGAYATFMAGIALLNGRFLATLHVIALIYGIALLVWYTLTRGVFIKVEGDELRVTRFFLQGRSNRLGDVVSIEQRQIFAGFITEVYMNVRQSDGTLREQGLINKPGLSKSEYRKLFDLILAINPSIQIDQGILHK